MAETTATDTTHEQGSEVHPVAQEAADNTPEKQDLSPEKLQQELRKAREEAARYRVERNELRGAAEKWNEHEEAQKSELQRAQEAAAELEAKYAATAAENQRLKVIARFGISEDNIDLLGSDPEKFEANAERLAALQAESARRSGPPSKAPVEDLRPGASDRDPAPDHSFPSDWPVTGPFANK